MSILNQLQSLTGSNDEVHDDRWDGPRNYNDMNPEIQPFVRDLGGQFCVFGSIDCLKKLLVENLKLTRIVIDSLVMETVLVASSGVKSVWILLGEREEDQVDLQEKHLEILWTKGRWAASCFGEVSYSQYDRLVAIFIFAVQGPAMIVGNCNLLTKVRSRHTLYFRSDWLWCCGVVVVAEVGDLIGLASISHRLGICIPPGDKASFVKMCNRGPVGRVVSVGILCIALSPLVASKDEVDALSEH
ncbi:hypothetical protein Tco_1417412 [Tanacetum coccineum]